MRVQQAVGLVAAGLLLLASLSGLGGEMAGAGGNGAAAASAGADGGIGSAAGGQGGVARGDVGGASAAATDVAGGGAGPEATNAGRAEHATGDGKRGGAEGTDGVRRRAQALMSEGVALLRRARFAAALARFRDAYQLFPSPKLLLNTGTTLRALGRNAESIGVYERYRSEPDADPTRLAEVEQVLADLYPRVAGVTVFVDDDLASARLDGRPLASLDGSRWIWLEPGEHVLLVQRAGRPTVTRVLRVAAGLRDNLVIELARPPAPPSRRPGELRTAAAVLGVAGAVGVAVGAVLGIVARVLDGEAADHCHPDAPTRCDATGASFGSYARGLETAAIVSVATAGTLGGVGLTLYLASPSASGPEPGGERTAALQTRFGGFAVGLSGRF